MTLPRKTPNATRQPIPRPWLERKEDDINNMDILGKPKWTVSWEKLRFCCYKSPNVRDEPNRNPFSHFSSIRRDSIRSFNSYDLYSTDASGSVSSFTDSEAESSSSYSSHTSYSFEEPTSQHQIRYPQTPPVSYTKKPPILTMRSKSAGLPPLNPSFSTPTPTSARNRCDTGDFTKTSTATNSSRHRRLQRFSFSPQSMASIWRDKGSTANPPLVVQVPDVEELAGVGYASSFDDSTNFESWSVGTDFQSKAQSNIVSRKKLPPQPPYRKSNHRPKRLKQRRKKEEAALWNPVYLPKKESLDNCATGSLILSGWVAASCEPNTLEPILLEEGEISIKDIHYMQIIDNTDGAFILLYSNDCTLTRKLTLERDWMCESREMTSRIGKVVSIRSPSATVASLLPVSLEACFFAGDILVSSNDFGQMKNRLFASGHGKVYAPDEQHDAATYVLFSLDALIKRRGK